MQPEDEHTAPGQEPANTGRSALLSEMLRRTTWDHAQLLAVANSIRTGRPLTPHQEQFMVERAIAWLESTWGEERPCPYCDNPKWEIGTPFEIAATSGPPLTASFPVMCSKCGHTVFINAVRAGLWPEWEPEK